MGLCLCFGGAACQIGGVFVKIPLIHLEVCLVIKEDAHVSIVVLACMHNISHALPLMSLTYSYYIPCIAIDIINVFLLTPLCNDIINKKQTAINKRTK